MSRRFPDLIRWGGTVDRRSYVLVGGLLFLLKQYIDRTVAAQVFHHEWTFFHYVIPSPTFEIGSLPPDEQRFYATMVLLALPFVWFGLLLTIKRLRDVPLPTWLVLLFFAPIPINLLFFLIVALLPRSDEIEVPLVAVGEKGPDPLLLEEVGAKPARPRGVMDRMLPENKFVSMLVAVVVPIVPGLMLGILSIKYFQNYGWGIFLGVPFALPAVSVMIYGYRRPRPLIECLLVGLLWMMVMVGALFLLAFEGAVCLILLIPLAIPVVLMGAFVGYLLQRRPMSHYETMRLMVALVAVLPALIGAEGVAPRPAPLFAIRSTVDIDAPPERVWRHVVEFHELPPPDDWLFRTGIAYPIRAEISGRGPGAIRHCVFSTGAFVEPIEVWDEPRLLRFSVTSSPPPMKEWSPIADIHPPHLEGYLASRRGQFLLTPLPGGRTRLEGTTWYQHHMWPAAYWRIWSDGIIRRIHLQVLRHVKRLAEDEA
jgi:uncharacterized membrane protein YhaH (DUF805 family)